MTKKPKAKRSRKQRRKEKVDVTVATATKQDEPLELEMQRLQLGAGNGNEDDLLEEAIRIAAVEKKEIEDYEAKMNCTHGYEYDEYIERFDEAYRDAMRKATRINGHAHIKLELFDDARTKMTETQFEDVWSDSTKIASTVRYLTSNGTTYFLKGKKEFAGICAFIACYFEQFAKVNIHKTQADLQANKILELCKGDDHTIVSFFRRRIPCTCLDEIYKEVKSIKKKGICWNLDCVHPEWLDRSNTMSCARCRNASYCSVECQRDHWPFHKIECDDAVAKRIAFDEAKCYPAK